MNYRKYFSDQLSGTGIDIGALHRPMDKHSGMNVKYVDRFTREDLKKHYPELKDFELIEADIIDDAETLYTIDSNSLDFVIAAHVIEHMKNPILAIRNWLRVLKPEGLLYLVVPDYRKIFDKYRELTSLEHLMADYDLPNVEADRLHFYEYAAHVNKKFFGRDIDVTVEAEKLIEKDYSIHFHTFTPESFHRLIEYIHNEVTAQFDFREGPVEDPNDVEFHYLVERI